MTRLAFRSRLFGILLLFAVVPALVLTVAWGVVANKTLSWVGGGAWERLAESGKELVTSLSGAELSPGQQAQLGIHARELEESITQARRVRFLSERAAPAVLLGGVLALALLGFAASRVAGHLSRQLSRPVDQLVGWTSTIARGEPLDETTQPRAGAPEFDVLRAHMRSMARELSLARARELEAERLRAFRESARRVAHELKNPLTPIRFALARIQREAPNELREPVDVIRVETERLDALARSFAQFGRLPEGPAAEIDVEEMVRYTTRATVPPNVNIEVAVAADVPRVTGHYDALQRALSNVLINAVEACGTQSSPRIGVRVERQRDNGHEGITIAVRDWGAGIPADRLDSIWEPYVTHKPGGTGLGLAIVRQTVEAHGGTVAASSDPGVGTEVRLTIPLGPQAEGGP